MLDCVGAYLLSFIDWQSHPYYSQVSAGKGGTRKFPLEGPLCKKKFMGGHMKKMHKIFQNSKGFFENFPSSTQARLEFHLL